MIKLRLNPDGEHDKKIEELISVIPILRGSRRHHQMKTKLSELTVVTRKLLKTEWEKVKRESEHGNLA